MASGLMHENNRQYERAAEVYRDVQRRFAGSEFARRATAALHALETGGAVHGIEFRRRQDAAWDQLFPAQALAARGDWRTARPGLQKAIELLGGVLRDFPDHPKAKDIAIALGNTHMLLNEYGAAQEAYTRAVELAERQSTQRAGGTSGIDNVVLDVRERLAEAIRAWRRQWMTRSAWALLTAIGAALLLLRPWREIDVPTLRLATLLVLNTIVLAIIAMGTSYYVRNYVDPHSPIEDRAAGLLTALPGITGVVVVLGYACGLRGVLHWPTTRATSVAAVLGVLAAVAVATCVINAFALFPVLDSDL
jgi:tetratricopeptide (TPR) repeat protein